MAFDVFISYSTKDKTSADAACASLERVGIRCWVAPRDILPGVEWDDAIVRAIDKCRIMVLIFSKNANESPQIRREVKRAFNRGIPVVPVRIENINPNEMLAYYMDSVHWLDAITPPLESHLNRLVHSVRSFLDVGAASRPLETATANLNDLYSSKQPAAPTEIKSGQGTLSRRTAIAVLATGALAAGAGLSYPYLHGAWTPERKLPAQPAPQEYVPAPSSRIGGGDHRIALVIGNSDYRNVAKLSTPAADARSLGEMFNSFGFDVTFSVDASIVNLRRTIRSFTDRANVADLAVIYFAGHGIEVGGINYLIPVDAVLATSNDVEDEALPLERLISSMEGVSGLRLILLDACRDNPFINTMKRTRTRGISSGLAKTEPEPNTLIAYAAKAGSVAFDGDGAHSPFAAALLKRLPTPGLDIRLVLGHVRDDVMRATNSRQEPFVYGSLGGSTVSIVPARYGKG
jgi:hypothetical protein